MDFRRLTLACALPILLFHGGAWCETPWEFPVKKPEAMGVDPALLGQARDYALGGGGSGLVIYRGTRVFDWGDTKRLFDLKSTTKSFGATVLGLALGDGKVSLDDRAVGHYPEFGAQPPGNTDQGWQDQITLFQLATQTAGFDKPGGYSKLVAGPGTQWRYSDCGPNWLAECLTMVYGRDLREVLFDRVLAPIGVLESDLTWRRNQYRPHEIAGIPRREFGSGISANVEAMARLGYLYLQEGMWQGQRILPKGFVHQAGRTPRAVKGLPVAEPDRYGKASDHYGLLWWNNGDGTIANLPRDAYWAWGLYDSVIAVAPSLDLVVARAGDSLRKGWSGRYEALAPLLAPIALAVPPRGAITGVQWAAPDTVRHAAEGSDNWPVAWGPDDVLYTAYGDGNGFAPGTERKLSLGLAVVTGDAANFTGRNLRAPTAEQVGDGHRGMKASGMVLVDGVLYMLARNAGNARMAWSEDHGATWTWCPWRFETSFGCPAFLDAGMSYEDARDEFVYVLSQDADSAYDAADAFVLARVPRDRIRDKDAYTYFAGCDGDNASWSPMPSERAPVLERPSGCYRGGMTYVAALNRYLLCSILKKPDGPLGSGLVIYEAPKPWGPWREVFAADTWDVDPGESARIPSRWVEDCGRTLHLLCSGGDSFAVRRARLSFAGE